MNKIVIYALVATASTAGIVVSHIKKYFPLSETAYLRKLDAMISPLDVSGCLISHHAYSAVERCYVNRAPSPQVFSRELSALGWRVSDHQSHAGRKLGAWCKESARITLSEEDSRWTVEYERAVAYSCTQK